MGAALDPTAPRVTTGGSKRGAAARLVLAFAVAGAPCDARAEGVPDLEVTRAEGAARCPDGVELRRLAAHLGTEDGPAHRYRVSFAFDGVSYVADVEDDTSPRSRRLVDKSPTCAPLAEAVALVLATMWTSEHAVPPLAPPSTPAPAPTNAPPLDAPSRPLDREGSRTSLASPLRASVSVGSGVAAALVRAVAPVVLADGALDAAHVSLAVGALWIPNERLGDGPGFVDVALVAGDARGCAFTGGAVQLGACARVFGGGLFATGIGYAVNAHATRPWFAGALEIFLAGPLVPRARLRYRLAFDAIAPLHAEEFSVAGAGPAYATPSFGGLLALAVEIGTR